MYQQLIQTFKPFRDYYIFFVPVVIISLMAMAAYDVDWAKVQKLKAEYLASAAKHAMAMQKKSSNQAVTVPLRDVSAHGSVKIETKESSLSLSVEAAPRVYGKQTTERVSIPLPASLDAFSALTGFAFTVETQTGTSGEVRAGLTLIGADGRRTQVQPIIPVLNAWGDRKHELYFDWAMLDFAKAEEVIPTLKSVTGIELTFASQRRAPERGPSEAARSATFTLSDLRFVDYHLGSFDPSRRSLKYDNESGKWVASDHYDLTLQQRYQEVTGIVASFGEKAGVDAAIQSLDYAVRTQCWDGSFLDGRRGAVSVASGEYTFGFTLYGLLQGYKQLENIKHPALDARISIGPEQLSRREFYQRMFYRGAMARTIATPSAYRDDIIGGNTLVNGANRVLGYAIAMRMIADVVKDTDRRNAIMNSFQPIMEEIAAAQGKFSGGFPVLGEGNKFDGKGIHYDAGYTRTHMDWLIVGARQTGDPLLVQILRKYQTVFAAAMNEEGIGILPMISERHQGKSPVKIILPDATYQVGVKYKLPIIAQWGYNVSKAAWEVPNGRSNFFVSSAHAQGYTLGAHRSILLDDLDAEPAPKDPGYLFPRQFPLWSTMCYDKAGALQRTSTMTFHADGSQTSDYRIEIGEYPVTVGVPVRVKSNGKVTATAHDLSGWPKLLPEGAAIQIEGDAKAKGRIGKPLKLKLKKETRLVITGPSTALPQEFGGESLPFRAEFTLTPEKPGQVVEITVMNGTVPYQYSNTGK